MDSPIRPATPATTGILTRLFAQMLQLATVSPDDDFFDLGGDSILAVSLTLEIERQTGRRVPVTALFDAPTPAALASVLEGADIPHQPTLVLLKSGTVAPAVFVVPGIGGTLLRLAEVARQVDAPCPIYGLQAPGLDGLAPPLASVEAMAAFYLAAIRGLQPQGPYVLAGYSFGGLVALEMAQRLRARGERVGGLVLLDTMVNPLQVALASRLRCWVRRARDHAARLRDLAPGDLLPYALARIRAVAAEIGPAPRPPSADAAGQALSAPARVMEATKLAAQCYRPRFYRGEITFVQAEPDAAWKTFYADIVWGALAQKLSLHPVRGRHLDLVEKDAPALAGVLSRCLPAVLGLPRPAVAPTPAAPFRGSSGPADRAPA